MSGNRTRARATAVELYRAEVARLEAERQATVLKARAIYGAVRRRAWERFAQARQKAWKHFRDASEAESTEEQESLVSLEDREGEDYP